MAILQSRTALFSAFVLGLLAGQVLYLLGIPFRQEGLAHISTTTTTTNSNANTKPGLGLNNDGKQNNVANPNNINILSLHQPTNAPAVPIDFRESLACQRPPDLSPAKEKIGSFSALLRSPEECYCDVWNFLLQHKNDYGGQGGDAVGRFRNEILTLVMDSVLKFGDPMHPRIAVEIGAHDGSQIGFYSQLLSRNREIYAFEANPTNEKSLQRAAKKIKMSSASSNPAIFVVMKAVSSKDGSAELDTIMPNNPPGNPHAVLAPNDPSYKFGGQKISVQTVTLDSYFADAITANKTFAFVSIMSPSNVAGIINGASKVLHRTKILLFSCGLGSRSDPKAPNLTHKDLQKQLSDLGFHTFKLGVHQWVPFSDEFYHSLIDSADYSETRYCISVKKQDPHLSLLWKTGSVFPSCNLA
eukprot:TRINITY_DN16063_c0_g1_i1.p1 TRINITY_DN16063_c0_g1~~TRINITY_DN16063_c0_g1_i1.p1  ORF type:complete len:414 (+),score=102.85 TRINITY_DN16063_c0_g1_i1:44-1285(+)